MESVSQNAGRTFSFRSVLLLLPIVGFGVSLAVYTIGGVFSAVASLAGNCTTKHKHQRNIHYYSQLHADIGITSAFSQEKKIFPFS